MRNRTRYYHRRFRAQKTLTQHEIARRALRSRLTGRAAELGRSYLPPARTTRPALAA